MQLSTYSELLLNLYKDAQDLPVDVFQDSTLTSLKQILPFDSCMWGHGVMKEVGLDIHSIHLYNSSHDMLNAYDKIKHLDRAALEIVQYPTKTMAFHSQSYFADDQYRKIREFCSVFGHENYWISSDVNSRTKFTQWISLYRKNREQLCTKEETELFTHLAPHLMQALAINRVKNIDRILGDLARERWTVAIADPRGNYYHTDQHFKSLQTREWPDDNPDAVPHTLLEELKKGTAQVSGKHVVVRNRFDHGLFYLQARKRVPADTLSSREILIARLLTAGQSQKQISNTLDRSPETIRSQVRSVFNKLNIHNVAALASHINLID